MPERVAFIGLGVMGFPMAGHLLRAGHDVTVFNRTSSRAGDWVARHGGKLATTPEEAAREARFVFSCVGNDEHLAQVMFSDDGVLAGLCEGGVVVDHTTASAKLARELARNCLARGIGFVDAPVSGGEAGAQAGTLSAMCGGRAEDFDLVHPLMGAYTSHARLLGPAGSGQLAKMVNQICIAGLLQGLAEGLHFAECAGLDAASVVDAIRRGAAQSWQMDNRHQSMLEGDYGFGFAVEWMRKDLGLALEEARRNGARLPVTALVDQFYSDLQAMGGNRWDTSSLIERLRDKRE